jgi:hypothetical protein
MLMPHSVCDDVRMTNPRRNPQPSAETAHLAELMQQMEDTEEAALRARLAFGKALKEARDNGVLQDTIAKELDTNREQLRRIQRRYEDTLKK